jgi:glycosyltransferase involved in cell wall biosynthesis
MTISKSASVLISQPVHQHAYEAAVAAQEAGLLRYFMTGLYYTGRGITSRRLRGWMLGPWGSKVERELRRRWHPELLPEHVVTLPYYHLLALTCQRTLGRLVSADLDTWAHQRFDIAVGARLRSLSGVRVVHAFEGTAEATLRSAKRLGIVTMLDVASAHEFLLAACAPNGNAVANKLSARVRSERELADYLLAPSEYAIRCLVEHGVPAHKIIKLPYGVDVERFQPTEKPAAEERFRVLFVGRLGVGKGVQYLLEAWRRLSLPRAELVLAGPLDRTGEDILRRHSDSFRWVGSIPKQEIHRWYADSDVFVFPSLSEGWPLVVGEAMATGLPVVATSVSGILVRHGVDGLVVPPADVDALCGAIQFLYDHPTERQQMGAAARDLVQRAYTWQQYRRRLRLVYEALLAGHSPIAAAVGSNQ